MRHLGVSSGLRAAVTSYHRSGGLNKGSSASWVWRPKVPHPTARVSSSLRWLWAVLGAPRGCPLPLCQAHLHLHAVFPSLDSVLTPFFSFVRKFITELRPYSKSMMISSEVLTNIFKEPDASRCFQMLLFADQCTVRGTGLDLDGLFRTILDPQQML